MEDCWESESISMLAGVQTENSTALRNARGFIGLGVLLASTDAIQSRNSRMSHRSMSLRDYQTP